MKRKLALVVENDFVGEVHEVQSTYLPVFCTILRKFQTENGDHQILSSDSASVTDCQ